MAAETKWTPGPWAIDRWGHIVDRHGKNVRFTAATIAGGTIGMPEPEANDALVATAPDLYELLREALEDYGARMPAGWVLDTERALAKARGSRSPEGTETP